MRIPRVARPLPPEALDALARATLPRTQPATRASVYRAPPRPDPGDPGAWYPVIERGASRPGELAWPVVRTALPAGVSALLAGSLLGAPATLGGLGAAGVLVGSVLTGLVARTQYTLERDLHALSAVWVASHGGAVLVARFPSLAARAAGRPAWHVLPVEALAPPPLELDHALHRWARRERDVSWALAALGLDAAAVDAVEAARIHALSRLGRLRRDRGRSW